MMKIAHVVLATILALGAAKAALADPLLDYYKAISLDNAAEVRRLVKQVDLNAPSPVSKEPALIVALRENALETFDVLLAQPGIKIEQTAPNGNNALMMAAFKGHTKQLLALLDKGAAVNRPGWSALHYAAAGGNDEIARILLARGAALNAPARGLLTPLMMAAREGHESTVKLLLDAGADTRLTDSDSQTARQIAEKADKPRIAAMIAERAGAKP